MTKLKRKYKPEDVERRRLTLLCLNERKREELIEHTQFENLPRELRFEVLFEERGYKCEKCGFEHFDPEKRGRKGPYEFHHLDGDNKNWKKENIEIRCLNCHWETPNYRFRGRHHSDEAKRKISENNGSRRGPVDQLAESTV